VVIGNHHDVDGLFCALATELLRIVDFDFIGLADTRKPPESRVASVRPDGSIERGTVDGTQEETMSEWVYQYQKPLVIPFLDHETGLHGKIKELANDGIQSLCAFPLTCVQQRIGSFLIGSKQPRPTQKMSFVSFL